MEFGIFNSLYTPHQAYEAEADQWAVEAQRLRNEVTWTKAADRNGFKYTWATEHHFLTEYSHLSSNEAFLGYIAGVTERIHIGSGIFNITPPSVPPPAPPRRWRCSTPSRGAGSSSEWGAGRRRPSSAASASPTPS